MFYIGDNVHASCYFTPKNCSHVPTGTVRNGLAISMISRRRLTMIWFRPVLFRRLRSLVIKLKTAKMLGLAGQGTFGEMCDLHKSSSGDGIGFWAFDDRPVSCSLQSSVVSLPKEMRMSCANKTYSSTIVGAQTSARLAQYSSCDATPRSCGRKGKQPCKEKGSLSRSCLN